MDISKINCAVCIKDFFVEGTEPYRRANSLPKGDTMIGGTILCARHAALKLITNAERERLRLQDRTL